MAETLNNEFDTTLEGITNKFQEGDANNPLSVEDINALDRGNAYDLIIDNKLPLTEEARGTLFSYLKFDDKRKDKFKSTYFTEEEIDTTETPAPPVEEVEVLKAKEKLFNKLFEDKLYTKTYKDFQNDFSTPSAQENLYKAMKKDKLYTKDFGEFLNSFFPVVDNREEEIETAPVDTAEVATVEENGSLVTTEGEEPKIVTGIRGEAKYTLDNLVDLKDDQFVKEFSNSGIQVQEISTFGGLVSGLGTNAVNVTLPGEEPVNINLKPTWPYKEEKIIKAKEQIQKILDYQNSLSDGTKRTLGLLASDDDYGNISQDALDVFGEGGYEVTKTKNGFYSSTAEKTFPAEYNVVRDGEEVFVGTNSQLKKYFIDNPLTEEESRDVQDEQYAKGIELSNIANTKAQEEIKNITKEVYAKEYYENNLANDIIDEFKVSTGIMPDGLDDYIKDYFNDSDDNSVRSEKIKNLNPEQLLRDFHSSMSGERGDTPDDFVAKHLESLQTAWSNIYEEPDYDENNNQTAGGLNKKIAKYTLEKNATITNTYLEKEMENSGLSNVVRSSIHATTLELEKTKVDLEKATEYFKPSFDKKQADLQVDIDNIIASAGGDGVTNIEYKQVGDNDGYYIVKANSPEVEADYQARLNKISKRSSIISSDFEVTRNNLNTKWNEYYSSLDDSLLQLESAAGRDYDFVNILSNDVGHSFENMLLDVPILFGSDAALKRKNQNQDYDASHLETMQSYDEAWNDGNFLFNMTRTTAQQSAPVTSAILGAYGATAVFGSVRGATVAKNLIPGFYGITSAGSKKGELETLEDYATAAQTQLDELLLNEDKLDPDVFRESKIALERTIADGTMESWNKWVTIIGTGVIEGTVTRFLGTLPNALKMVDDFANPLDDVLIAATKNGYQNAANGVGKFLYRTGMEVAEEELIAIGSMALESQMLNKDFDFSQLDDVAVAAIMVAGPMNGPGIAYSTIAQHNVTRDMYSRNKAIQQELARIDNDFGNLNPNKKGYQNQVDQLREERQEQLNKVIGLTSELEVNAMLTGGKKVGDLMVVGNQLNQLDKQANVDPTLSPEAQDKQRELYIASLSKAESKAWKSEYDTALKAKEKILNSVDYTNAVERLYGTEGKRIQDRLLKKDPSLKKDPKALVVAVHQEIKNKLRKNKAAITREDKGVLDYVERQVYDGKTFKESGRKKRNRKKEDELLARIGDQLGITSRNTGLIVNANESINAAKVLKDKRLEDLDLKVAETDEDLQKAILNAYDAQKKKDIDVINRDKSLNKEQKQEAIDAKEAQYDEIAEGMIDELRMGETNGAIIGDQYIVKDKKAALAEIETGNILAGTVLSHEIAHGVDQLAFANMDEMLTYALGLHSYMSENHKEIHDAAMLRMRFVGGDAQYNPEAPLTKQGQKSEFWDEYTKSIQDVLKRPKYSSEVRQILNKGQGTMNKFRAMVNGDYKITNGRDAAVYVASFIDNFKKGELGELQKRRIDVRAKDAKKEGLKETKKSANIKSPLLYDQANDVGKKVNDLFAAKDSNPNFAFDIAKLFEPMLGKYLRRIEDKGAILGKQDEFGNVSQDERQKNITDFKMNGMYGERGIVDLIDKFNPDEMVDVVDPKTGETVQEANTMSKWLNGVFPQRLSEFTENTTVDFQGFKVDIDKASNIFTTETDEAINNILTPEVQDQLNTPFLDNLELTEDQVVELREAITSIVGRKLPALDVTVSKNKSVSPLIAALKKEFGVKNGPLHRLVQNIIGNNKLEVEGYLKSPKNKRAILQTLTTTWLSKNLSIAVQKDVNGIGYTTDHKGRTKGTKPGQINFWKSSEDGPYKGMTDGKQKIRRNPNANNDVSNAMLLSSFTKGASMTDMRRAGLEKLELALAQEFGLEVFKADMINEGALKDIFVQRQDLFDRILANNFVEEFVRQTERGITKRSGNYNLSAGLQMDFGTEVVDLAIKHGYGTLEFEAAVLKAGIPQEFIISFDESGLADMFSKDSPKYKERLEGLLKDKKLKPETKKLIKDYLAMGSFSQANQDLGNKARVQSAKSMKKLVEELPLEIFLSPAVTKQFFGFDSSNRGFDMRTSSDNKASQEAKDAMTELGALINNRKKEAKQALKDSKINPDKLGFDPSKTRTLNAGMGLMGKVQNILALNIKADEKKRLVKEELGKEIENANQNNPKLHAFIQNKFLELAIVDDSMMIGMLYYNQMATSNTSGQRALSMLQLIQYQNGSQGLWIAEVERGKGKNKKVQTEYFFLKGSIPSKAENIRPNTNHPDYSAARVIAEDRVKRYQKEGLLENTPEALEEELIYVLFGGKGAKDYKGGMLRGKGEHVTPSAGELGKISVNAINAFDKRNIGDFNETTVEITSEFEQSLGSEALSFVQDKILGATSELGSARIISLIGQQFVNINSFKTLDGQSAQERMNDKFFNDKNIKEIHKKLNKFKNQNKEKLKILNNAIKVTRRSKNPNRGITILDFDDTLATTKSLVKFTRPDGTTGTLNAEEYASTYQDLLDQGFTFDFSEFNKVVKGKLAPLFNKAIKLQGKFGPENMFVLTARPPAAQKAIFDFLKANGLNIPIKNITGLGDSTAEAKALWVADKVAEGYNDFYFADDALQNVQAVKNMLNQFDVKGKVQQARAKFSKNMSIDFNNILENVTSIESEKRFSDIKARKRGESKGKFKFFIPPSHEDFVGLLYNFMGKGKEGNAHRDFFEKALVGPLNRGYREIDTAKQAIANDYKELNKQFPNVKKKLIKNTPDGDFTFQDAIRVYLWNKHGYKIPGLTPTDQAKLVELVMNDAELRAYAETLNVISKQDKYVDPGQSWDSGNIRIDLIDATGRVGRAEYFAEFNENVELIFSAENLNKIEAAYGKNFREALEDMLHRIKTGVNRPKGSSAKPNMFMNWLNASVSGVMFFNTRSALLQQLSNVNFLNFADNNIFAAGLAFANQPQYWKDFAMIFNSDMLKQRRGGLGTDINGAELAEAIKKARPDNMFDQVSIIVGKALKLGFLPTQIGDNIAIATGGAAFYRNRVNKYIKDGLAVKEAEAKAFTDLQNITNSTQQSARPDMTSKQQSMWIGKLVLNFLNTPSQYNRIIKKAGSDILNRRITPPNTTQMQSDMSNTSRILYYGAAQNLIFYSLQTALFAVMFGTDDEDDDKRAEQFLKKKERVINGSIDTILRGSGIYGVAVSTLKNMVIKFLEQRDPKKYNKDEAAVLTEALNFSPVVGIKARRIVNAEKTLNYNVGVINEMETFDAENPTWSAVTNYTQAITGAPVNKMYQKAINLRNAADNQYTTLQRALFLSGYTTWSLNLGDTQKMKDVKEKVKTKKKEASKVKREEKKKEKLKEKEAIGIEKQKKEKKEGKEVTCLVCKLPVEKGQKYCTIHEKKAQRKDGAKIQCRKYKSNGKRCGMKTASKSGYCYYHD